MQSVFSEKEASQIAQTERNEGRLQAVDQLFNKLLKLKDLRWTNLFPIILKTQHPEVFDKVTKTRDGLLKEDVFSRCRCTVGNTLATKKLSQKRQESNTNRSQAGESTELLKRVSGERHAFQCSNSF